MANNVNRVARFIQDQFPELQGKISSEIYPSPPLVELAMTLLGYIQMFGIAWMIVGGENLLRMIGYRIGGPAGNTGTAYPRWYLLVQENAMMIGSILFFIAPQFIQSFTGKGAFEIILNQDQIIFSKIQHGRFPIANDLIDPLVTAGLKLNVIP